MRRILLVLAALLLLLVLINVLPVQTSVTTHYVHQQNTATINR